MGDRYARRTLDDPHNFPAERTLDQARALSLAQPPKLSHRHRRNCRIAPGVWPMEACARLFSRKFIGAVLARPGREHSA